MFPKKKRIINKDLLEEIKNMPCICCGHGPSDPHHVTTVGAGGGDTYNNVVPLCRKHHTEYHKIGPAKFCFRHIEMWDWLIKERREDIINKIGISLERLKRGLK